MSTAEASAAVFQRRADSLAKRLEFPAEHRLRLLASYGLLLTEHCLRLALPLVIGLAIDDLLGSSCRGLLIFAVVYLVLTVTTAAGAMLRIRVFTALHAALPAGEATRETGGDIAVHDRRKLLTRLEQTIPDKLHGTVAIGGALLLLGWYDPTLMPFGLLLLVPFWLLRTASQPRLSALEKEQQRAEADIEATAAAGERTRHLHVLHACRVRMADTVTSRTALTELFVLGMLASAIVHFVGRGAAAPSAGDTLAVVCYLLVFVSGLRGRPVLSSCRSSAGTFLS